MMMNLLSSLRSQYEKSSYILSCLCRVFVNQQDTAALCDRITGFAVLLDILTSTKDDIVNEDENISQRAFAFFRSVMRTINLTITLFNSNYSKKPTVQRMKNNQNQKFKSLAQCIVALNIFSTRYQSESIDLIFEFLSGRSVTPSITNLDGVALVVELLDQVEPSVALKMLDMMRLFAFTFPEGRRSLSHSRFISLAFAKYPDIFKSSSNPVSDALSVLVMDVMKTYLIPINLALILNHLVRPEVVVGNNERLLCPFQSGSQEIQDREWKNVKVLLDIVDSSKHNVPFTSFESVDGSNTSFPYLMTSVGRESSLKGFPWSKFSFSIWIKFVSNDISSSVFTPILALASDADYSYIEFHYNPYQCLLRLYARNETHEYVFADFRHPERKSGWIHFGVSCVNAGYFGLTRPEVLVYIDGIQAESLISNRPINKLDIPIEKDLTLSIGKSYIGGKTDLAPFHLGSFMLFDDILRQEGSIRIFLKGPSYKGLFQGENPLEDYLSSLVTSLMRICDSYASRSFQEVLNIFGLEGIERTVEPSLDPKSSYSYPIPKIPKVLIGYFAENSSSFIDLNFHGEAYASSEIMFSSTRNHYISNSTSYENMTSRGDLYVGKFISDSSSFSHVVAALGGPDILIPLLHAASNEKQIKLYIDLIFRTLDVSTNLKSLQRYSYRNIAAVCSMKPTQILTSSVLQSFFELCVHRNLVCIPHSVLFVDSLAMFHLLLNHQIWDSSRRMYVENIITKHIAELVLDSHYGHLNCYRLSKLGVVRWISLLIVKVVVNFSKLNSAEYSGLMDCSHSFLDLADGSDVDTPFLMITMDVLMRIILSHDLRLRDLELFSQIILYLQRRSEDEFYEVPIPVDLLRLNFLRMFSRIFIMNLDDKKPVVTKGNTYGTDRESKIFEEFKKIVPPAWYLMMIERKHYDIACNATLLKLLGHHLQLDQCFYNEFRDSDGFKVLEFSFSGSPQPLCIVLPLIAIAFQIPMKYMPFANTVDSEGKVVRLLDLQESLGPTEDSVPLLNCLFDILAVNSRAVLSQAGTKIVSNVLVSFFLRAFECNMAFRELLQTDQLLKILTRAFMTSIGMTIDSASVDIVEDAVPIQVDENGIELKSKSRGPSLTIDTQSNVDSTIPEASEIDALLNINTPEGKRLSDMFNRIILDALFQFRNPSTIAYLFVSFPKMMQSKTSKGYQLFVIDKIKTVLPMLFSSMDVQAFQVFASALTFIVPMLRARVIHDEVLYQLLIMSIQAVADITGHEIERTSKEKLLSSARDIGMSARYFAILAIHVYSNVREGNVTEKIVYEAVRSSIHLLSLPFVEDALEVSPSFRAKKDHQAVGPAALESFAVFWLSSKRLAFDNKKNVAAILQHAVFERNSISSAFCMLIFLLSVDRLLADNQEVSKDCMRIISLLLILKEKFMNKFFPRFVAATKLTKAVEADTLDPREFPSIFAVLLPSDKSDRSGYEAQLRFHDVGIVDSELQLHDEFVKWIQSNNAPASNFFSSYLNGVNQILPSPEPVQSVLKRTQFVRSRSLPTAGDLASPAKRRQVFKRICGQVNSSIKQWSLYGVANTAVGAITWRRLWTTLQSSTIWSANTSSIDSSDNVSWKLCSLEGPERSRLRLDRDEDESNEVVKVAIAAANRNSSVEEIKDDQGIQEFLQAISKQGAIRVKRESTLDGDSTTDASETTADDIPAAIDINGRQSTVDDDSVSNLQGNDANETMTDVDYVENDGVAGEKSVRDVDESGPSNGGDALSTEKDSPTQSLSTESISSMLLETMRGIVGQRDWRYIRCFNVQR